MPAHLIAEEGPLRGLVLNFEEGEDWIIGRDPDIADFVIEDSTVSRKHARITKTPQGIFLQNLSRVNPVLINEEEHAERTLLKEGDRVQIGNHTFLFSEEPLPDIASSAKKKSSKKQEKTGYDDIFGELEEPPPPPREEEPEEERDLEETPSQPKAEREETAYDTIFEDIESSGELPFNLLQPTALLLKVISGPNAGAEIGIEKDRSYIIGKDPNSCDVVFQDLSVSRNHARLSIDADGRIELEDLGSKNGTFVNGAPISEKTAITPQDMISLGTTVFLIIDREAPQETIYSPMVPTYESAKTPLRAIGEELKAEPAQEEAVDWKKQPIPKKHLILAGSFVGIFFIVFLSFFSLFKSEPLQVHRKEPVEQIKEALAKYNAVQFSFNPGSGKLFLTGHVLTGVDYQEMMYRIDQINFIQGVENTVVIDELVWKTMNDIISNNPNWRSISIHSPQAGKFVVNGYVQTGEQAAQLNEYLTVNFPYLDRLQNRVVTEETLNAEIQSILVMHGFGGVSFQLTGGNLLLTGGYNSKMKSDYEKIVKALNALPGIAKVQDLALAGAPGNAGINITQQYQIGGSALYDGKGYSVVLNGKIYTMGDAIDGMQITSIEQKTILLEKDGLKYRIDYR